MFVSQVNLEKLIGELTNYDYDISENCFNTCERILFTGIEDTGETGDVILLFGSPTCLKYRVKSAFQAYFAKRAPLILTSGGVKLPGFNMTEAEGMRDSLIRFGVPRQCVTVENESKYTHENVMFSSDIIKRICGGVPVRILLATSISHMRRVLLNMEFYRELFVKGTTWYPCPSPSTAAEPYMWRNTPEGRYKVAERCSKIITYIRAGYLNDFEII